MNPEKIGKFICELRKEKNLSQYQLADMIPISRQGVSKWERGVTTPNTQTLIQLSEMFDVTIDELLRGERRETHSIKDLEETALSILDQSNKKTKTIKRITIASISIITILLLAFLSYYFINSYNSMEVYKIGNTSEKFTTVGGIFIVTKEKYYFKLGKLKNKDDEEIYNIRIVYKKNNKDIILVEDKEVDNLMIMDSYGYGEKFSKEDINKLKDNLYMEITSSETGKTIFKLRYKRYYKNSSLFFLNQKNVGDKVAKENSETEKLSLAKTAVKLEEKKEESKEAPDKKEETKATINETTKSEQKTTEKPKEETKIEEKNKETTKSNDEKVETQEESKTEKQTEPESQPEEEPEPQQPEEPITTEQVINKIKETCANVNGTYTCEYNDSNIVIIYASIMNKITINKNNNLIGQYSTITNKYICFVDDCETIFNEAYKEYLFK